jgi:hypothetical protein
MLNIMVLHGLKTCPTYRGLWALQQAQALTETIQREFVAAFRQVISTGLCCGTDWFG